MMRQMGCLQLYHMILLALAIFQLDTVVAASLCHPDDSYALLRLKESWITNPSYQQGCDPKMNFWNKSRDCCAWNGVSCDEISGHVIGLDLGMSCIIGKIYPNSSLFSLQHIQKLNLAHNSFQSSPIPSEFGRLSSLTHLNLSTSMFTGDVPVAMSRLTELVSLDLSRSHGFLLSIESQILAAMIQNLTKLRELVLFAVNLYGASLHSFKSLPSSLVVLNLMGCSLDGEFPESVFHLPNLESFTLSGNRELKGIIPEFFNRTSPLKFLDLSGTQFSGYLPSSIGNLKSLERLVLSECNFTGAIPTSVGNLTHLTYLDLSTNNITGELPSSLSHLHQLTYLDLSANAIRGCLPDVFGNMSKLEHFDLTSKHSVRQSSSKVTCQLPLSIFNLAKLAYFRCPGCQLVGSLSNSISGLSSLTSLDLSHNFINGTIPSWLVSLPSLESLNLGNNQLSGQLLIPSPASSSKLGGFNNFKMSSTLQNLTVLDLSNNRHLSLSTNKNFNYSFPSLKYLNLSSCNISELPHFLKGATSLAQLDLSKNRIQGKIPKWMTDLLSSWDSLQFIDIHSNLIEGPLPVPPPSIEYFRVSNNKFTGEIPTLVCTASALHVLDLANNSLSGIIPKCIGNFSTSLTALNLGSNSFHSDMPEFISVCDGLEYLNMNGNQLSGLLPRSLANCQFLEVLDLGNNLIDDTFPMWMHALPNLTVLVLHQNKFHGPLNNQKIGSSFPSLQIIDLSGNGFIGHMTTDYFPKLKAKIQRDDTEDQYIMGRGYYFFSIDYSVKLTVKYIEMDIKKIFFAHAVVDFSSNKFTGEIPERIGKLEALKGLNLSHNHLKGGIPETIGNLKYLEWLDLGSNNLTGNIPVQLTKLTFLGTLTLSYNQLEGPIPQGNSFNTFDSSSFEGNSRLCGSQLAIKCKEDQENAPPQSTSEEEDSWDAIYGFSWTTISIGYGCGTAFGILMGYLSISRGRPKWILRIADRGNTGW